MPVTGEPGPAPRGLVARADRLLVGITEAAASLLVLAEIIVLLSGVMSRYVLVSPLTWSDELASLIFLWLVMFGAAVALQRGVHMRMTSLVDIASPGLRAFLDLTAIVCTGTFLALIAGSAYDFARSEAAVTLPTLGISRAWRASAVPVGVLLMVASSLLKLAAVGNRAAMICAILLVGLVMGAFEAGQPVLQELGNINLLIFFVGLLAVLVFSGIPIAFSFGLATFGYLALTTATPLVVVIGRMDEGMSHLILLAVPLFVFLGYLMQMTGMANSMVTFLASLLGHMHRGLAYVLIGAMYLVSGISGSKAADMAAVAPVLVPEMRNRGAQDGEIVALLAATGAQTETIPPSIVLIAIGSVTGISISSLFKGGLLPSLVLAVILGAVVWLRPRASRKTSAARATWRQFGGAFVAAAPALLLPFLIRGAVAEGVATATEVSTLAIVYSMLAGIVVYRQFDWLKVWPALVDTASMSGAILLIIGTATGMAWSLTQSGFSHQLAHTIALLPGGAAAFLAVSIVAFIILGSVLEGIPAIVLFAPLFFPIASRLGIDEVHYAMVVVLSMGIGLFAPPFGVGYYTACAICHISPSAGMRPIRIYLLALLAGTALIAAVPSFSTVFLR